MKRLQVLLPVSTCAATSWSAAKAAREAGGAADDALTGMEMDGDADSDAALDAAAGVRHAKRNDKMHIEAGRSLRTSTRPILNIFLLLGAAV